MSAADISTAVTEAQAVLTLVRGQLRMTLADAPVLAVEGDCHFHHVHIIH